MAASVSAEDLRQALERWAHAVREAAPELNVCDARLGDGDLGATLEKCASNVLEVLPTTAPQIDAILKACASACAKASGSSFGTLLAVGFLTAGKSVMGAQSLARMDIVRALDNSVAALSARGGAATGDKTMLDSLDSIARALQGAVDETNLRAIAVRAASDALDIFRDRPNRVGRARMFADKSSGIDDPGMVAVLRMTQCL